MLLSIGANAQDTIFIRSLELPLFTDNVTTDGNTLFIKSADTIYKWENSKLQYVSKADLKYSWYNKSVLKPTFTHTTHIPKSSFTSPSIQHLLPGVYNGKITTATIQDKLYISFNGSILEFKIESKVEHLLKGVSVRHIYIEPSGIRVISTYAGVFYDLRRNDITSNTLSNSIAVYSNGSFNKINDRYFLCQDDLIEYDLINQTSERRMVTEGQPRFRQLFEFNNKVFSVMTIGVNRVDLERFKFDQYLLQNKEITSYKVNDSVVVFGSRKNGIYIMDNLFNLRRISAPKKINDLIVEKENLLICTDKGLYRMNLKTGKYRQLTSERYLHNIVKYKNGFIYSGDRGLYWYNGTQSTPLIKNVEFNKLALLMANGNLYAGSINGLYKISESDLQLLTNTSFSQYVNKSNTNEKYGVRIFIILTMIVLVLAGILIYIFFQKKKENKRLGDTPNRPLEEITHASVKQLILQNKSIKSVEHIALYYKTSVSQVNRRLKLENTSPLRCLKETKREIVLKMEKKGKSIEEMSKRVGYSKRYIKDNFLKGRSVKGTE